MSRLPILSSRPADAAAPLPTVQALHALWQQVQARPLWAPPHFWRYVRLRLHTRLHTLDAAQLHWAAPTGKINDCSACTDLCCVGPQAAVLLRLRDIATLIDIGRTELITHEKPRFSPQSLAARPALRRQLDSRAWEIFPILRQNAMGACSALSREGACTLYPHWPMACARFPYALHLQDQEIFYSRRCQSFWVHPRGQGRATSMAVAAVAAYNERIRDNVLLAYAPEALKSLGLWRYLRAI